jgi:predicted AAA+ superfamily ATPase
MKLYKRHIFDKIQPYIGDDTILVLLGARQVGKTHILRYIEQYLKKRNRNTLFYDLEYPELLALLNLGTEAFVTDLENRGHRKGEEIFVFIDEIQYLENPSSFLKIMADHHKHIRLIVSGSSTFDIKTKFTDSLAGRTLQFEVFPLSFAEFLTFKESAYTNTDNLSPAGLQQMKLLYAEYITFGGYPKIVLEPDGTKKKQHLLQLIDTYIRKDIRDLADVTDIAKFNGLLKILSSQSAQLLNISALSRETGISQPTVSKYLSILEETFVIKRVTPFSRSPKVEISKNPKVFFLDSGLQTLLWLSDFPTTMLGNVFETNVFGELIKRYGRQNINYWRTKSGLEVDFVVHRNSTLTALEVKSNFQAFSDRTITSFCRKHSITDWQVVGLEGKKTSRHALYPWEIS